MLSVLSNSVTVEKGAYVKDCVLFPGVTVKAGAHLNRCIVASGTIIGENVRAGSDVKGKSPYLNEKICQEGIVVIEGGLRIKADAVIPANCQVDKDIDVSKKDNVIEEIFRV